MLKRLFFLLFLLILPIQCLQAKAPLKKIAVLVSKNGTYSNFGDLQMKGYELARIDLGSAENSLDIRYFDIGWTAAGVDLFLRDEVLKWKPDLIVGPYSSSAALDIVQALNKSDPPLIVPSAIADALTEKRGSNVFRVAVPARRLSDTVGDFIQQNHGNILGEVKHITILSEKTDLMQDVTGVLYEVLEKKGLYPIEVLTYEELDELNEHLETVKERENNVAIIISHRSRDCIVATEALKDRARLLGFLFGFLTQNYRQYAIDKNVDIFLVSPFHDDQNDPLVDHFFQNFQSKFATGFADIHPHYHSVQAYTALRIAGEAITFANKEGLSTREVLLERTFPSPLGDINFTSFEDYHKQASTKAVIRRLRNGRIKTIFPLDKRSVIMDEGSGSKKSSFLMNLLNNEFIALFMIIALGLLLGNVKIAGICLGSSGVLFVALLFGHFHFTIPSGLGTLGLIFFIFCVGIGAGPRFFRAFVQRGVLLAKLAIIIVIVAALLTVLLAKFFNIPRDLAVGLFAGALTSTPALASALDYLKNIGSLVAVGYGISYPFGVASVVLFVQLFPRILKKNLEKEAKILEDERGENEEVVTALVETQNPSLFGKNIGKSTFISTSGCRISRVLKNGHFAPMKFEETFSEGKIFCIVGLQKDIDLVADFLGREIKKADVEFAEVPIREFKELVITSGKVVGKNLETLEVLKNYGITVTRIVRGDITFIPTIKTRFELYDQIHVVGEEEDIKRFSAFCGHKKKVIHKTDLFSLIVGLLLGVVLGLMPMSIAGNVSFSVGLSGGILFVSLLLGHFGRLGRILGRIPLAARNLMMELGLVFFLANAGIKAGNSFMQVLETFGPKLFLIGAIITTVPLMIGYLVGTYIFKIRFIEILGAICGGMTSTPALGVIKSRTDSDIPVLSYAAAYPVALIFMIIAAQCILITLKALL